MPRMSILFPWGNMKEIGRHTSDEASVSAVGVKAPRTGLAASLTGRLEILPKLFSLPMSPPPGVLGVCGSAFGVPGAGACGVSSDPDKDCCRVLSVK